jgi:hypothetical protein
MVKKILAAFTIAATLFVAIPARADPTVSIDQSGLTPVPDDIFGWTEDCTADFDTGNPNVEIPDNQITYSWSVLSVQVDPNFGSNYVAADPDDYDVNFTDGDQQSSTLNAEIYADGNWMININVTVTYPDGYCTSYKESILEPRHSEICQGGIARRDCVS